MYIEREKGYRRENVNVEFSTVLSWALTHTQPWLPIRSSPPGKWLSPSFQNEILHFKSNLPNSNTTIHSGIFSLYNVNQSSNQSVFRLKFAQQANALGPWIQQKTEEIVGVALEMDGTLEQQIGKLKSYQVSYSHPHSNVTRPTL